MTPTKKICKIKLIVPHNHTKMATFHTIKSGAGGLRVAEPFHPPKEKRYSRGGGRVRLHVSLGRLHLVKNHIVSKSQLPWTSTLIHKHQKYTFLLFHNEMPLKISFVKRKTLQFRVFKFFSLSMRPTLYSIPTVNNKNTWMEKNPLTVLSFNKDHFLLDNFHAIYESYKMVYICRERRTQSDFLLVRFPSLACVRIICLVFVFPRRENLRRGPAVSY